MAAVATVRKIDEIGRMSIPIDILRGLNINKGDKVDIVAEDGERTQFTQEYFKQIRKIIGEYKE